MSISNSRVALVALAAMAFACTSPDDHDDDDHGDHDHDEETEIISQVELRFTPVDGGDPLVFTFSDPDGDGGASGTADEVVLALGTSYSVELTLTNDLADPPVDISEEIADEAEEHMVFLYGEGVAGEASSSSAPLVTTSYADLESDYAANAVGEDLPVGLAHELSADAAGTGTLRVMLRHLPPLNDNPQKSADLPATFAAGEALPGDVDVDVSFDLRVE